jgi:hypothetical protein
MCFRGAASILWWPNSTSAGLVDRMALRDEASFGCQQWRVARRYLEKLDRLTTIAYRTRNRNSQLKQHAIFRHANSARIGDGRATPWLPKAACASAPP